jgi:hypothetical protein
MEVRNVGRTHILKHQFMGISPNLEECFRDNMVKIGCDCISIDVCMYVCIYV